MNLADGEWGIKRAEAPPSPLAPQVVLSRARSLCLRSVSEEPAQSKLIDQAAEALATNNLAHCRMLLEQAESLNSVAKDQYHLWALLEYLEGKPDSAISYAYDELRAYPDNELCRLFLEQLIAERLQKPIPAALDSGRGKTATLDGNSKLRIGTISSWGTKCGIAVYAEDMVLKSPPWVEHVVFGKRDPEYLPEHLTPGRHSASEPKVLRTFHDITLGADPLEELFQAVLASQVQAVNFQFNYTFFVIAPFCRLVERLAKAGIKVIITFHATTDGDALGPVNINMFAPCSEYISLAVCFKQVDIERLSAFLPPHKIWKTNLAIRPFAPLRRSELQQARKDLGLEKKTVVAQHGFLLPNKGVEVILEALGLLKHAGHTDFHFLAVTAAYLNAALTQNYVNQLIPIIQKYDLVNQITFLTDFLPHEEVYKLLSLSDVVAYPYTTSSESASGAIRNAIITDAALITTPLHIFADIRNFSRQTTGISGQALAEELLNHRNNPPRDLTMLGERADFIQPTAAAKLSAELHQRILEIVNSGV